MSYSASIAYPAGRVALGDETPDKSVDWNFWVEIGVEVGAVVLLVWLLKRHYGVR